MKPRRVHLEDAQELGRDRAPGPWSQSRERVALCLPACKSMCAYVFMGIWAAKYIGTDYEC